MKDSNGRGLTSFRAASLCELIHRGKPVLGPNIIFIIIQFGLITDFVSVILSKCGQISDLSQLSTLRISVHSLFKK